MPSMKEKKAYKLTTEVLYEQKAREATAATLERYKAIETEQSGKAEKPD